MEHSNMGAVKKYWYVCWCGGEERYLENLPIMKGEGDDGMSRLLPGSEELCFYFPVGARDLYFLPRILNDPMIHPASRSSGTCYCFRKGKAALACT
jgi:hypothetical protein